MCVFMHTYTQTHTPTHLSPWKALIQDAFLTMSSKTLWLPEMTQNWQSLPLKVCCQCTTLQRNPAANLARWPVTGIMHWCTFRCPTQPCICANSEYHSLRKVHCTPQYLQCLSESENPLPLKTSTNSPLLLKLNSSNLVAHSVLWETPFQKDFQVFGFPQLCVLRAGAIV